MLNQVRGILRDRRTQIGMGLLIVAIAAGLVVLEQRATAARPEPWLPFTMVYQDTRVTTSTGDLVVQTFRLEYVDSRHFVNTLLSNSAVPGAAGWTHIVNGTGSTTTDPRLGTVSSATWKPEEQTLPDDWLRPGITPWLAYRPGALVTALGGGLSQARIVSNLDGRIDIEQLTYRPDGIPTQYTETVDGKEVRHVEVLTLTLN
jgi:hypothetical protein